jgi:hypothetical protein
MTDFQTFFWSFPAETQKGGVEELRALSCKQNKKETSVRQVVVKACSGDWGGGCRLKFSAKDRSTAFGTEVPVHGWQPKSECPVCREEV